jgi:hypothetical protein
MKHCYTTNLLKGSVIYTLATMVFLLVAMSSCNGPEMVPETCPLVGHWKVTAVETKESRGLDELSRKIYQQEVDKILDSAAFVISADSSYRLRIGGDREQGSWKWDTSDSLLRLESQKGQNSYYKIQRHGQQSFILKKEMDTRGLELTIAHLPQ